jgi:hypothetical protein
MTSASVAWLISGLATPLDDVTRIGILVTVSAIVLAQELRLIRLRLPASHRQVPQEVFTNGPYRAAMRFGFELGTGVRTYLPSSVPYLLLTALLVLQPPLGLALLAGASFGLGRASMAAFRTASSSHDRWDEQLRTRLGLIQPVSAFTGISACAMLAI